MIKIQFINFKQLKSLKYADKINSAVLHIFWCHRRVIQQCLQTPTKRFIQTVSTWEQLSTFNSFRYWHFCFDTLSSIPPLQYFRNLKPMSTFLIGSLYQHIRRPQGSHFQPYNEHQRFTTVPVFLAQVSCS